MDGRARAHARHLPLKPFRLPPSPASAQPVACSVGEAASRRAPPAPSTVPFSAIDTTRLFLADSYGDDDGCVQLQLRSPQPRSPRRAD